MIVTKVGARKCRAAATWRDSFGEIVTGAGHSALQQSQGPAGKQPGRREPEGDWSLALDTGKILIDEDFGKVLWR